MELSVHSVTLPALLVPRLPLIVRPAKTHSILLATLAHPVQPIVSFARVRRIVPNVNQVIP